MIRLGVAKVYYGNGRRYLTLRSACMAEARAFMRNWFNQQGEDWRDAESSWYCERVRRLAGLYMARHRRMMKEEWGQ